MATSDSESNEDVREQFLEDYYAECDEHLMLVRKHLLAIEGRIGEGQIDIALVDELFRSFHTIKGISGMVGLAPAEELAHGIESMLKSIRQAEMTLDAREFERMIEGVRLLERVIASRRANEPLPAIHAMVQQPQKAPAETSRLGGNERKTPARAWKVEFTPTPALAERGITINGVRARLQEAGEILRSAPQIKGESEISFQFLVESAENLPAVRDWAADGVIIMAAEDNTPRDLPKFSLTSAPSSFVRVDLARLDELMRMVGEMVTTRARLEEQVQRAQKALPPGDWRAGDWRALWDTTQTIGRQVRNLREGAMRMRMTPVGEIFERMQFVVRDLARESGKRVVVDIVGRETEIDKLLVERMMVPLVHLVRNAVSHGLEQPEERKARGKAAEARLTLKAMTSGGNVIIMVGDDGRGIDTESVRERARVKGLIDPNAIVDDALLLESICQPGFSTRAEVNRESGRGVGMDVVKSTVDALNGRLSLSTEKGKGTQFQIELPLTLAIADALVVGVSGQTYAAPQTAVREVIEVDPSTVRALEHNEIVPYRNGALPLLRLAKFFNLAPSEHGHQGAFHVLVTGGSGERSDLNPAGAGNSVIGFAVDRVLGHKEIVVRGISDELAQVPGIAGATDLGDDRVILILDVPALRRFALDGRAAGAGV